MSTADLAFVTAMLRAQRDRCHEDLVALDAAISRLDALHDAALATDLERSVWQARARAISEKRRALLAGDAS